MNYLENQNDGVPAETARMFMENAGIDFGDEPSYGEVLVCAFGDSMYQLSESFVEHDGDMYIPISNLSDAVFESIQDDIDPVAEVKLDEDVYSLTEEVVELDGEVMIKLFLEGNDADEEDDNILEVNGVEYNIVENESDATAFAYLKEDGDDYTLVDTEDEADFIAYLSEE